MGGKFSMVQEAIEVAKLKKLSEFKPRKAIEVVPEVELIPVVKASGKRYRHMMKDDRINFKKLTKEITKINKTTSYAKMSIDMNINHATISVVHKVGTCSSKIGDKFIAYFGDKIRANP